MDQAPCVLLEALKQFIDNPEAAAALTGTGIVEHENQMESMSQKSAARAKQLLSKLCKKKERKAKKETVATNDRELATTPPSSTNKLRVPQVEVKAPVPTADAAMVLSTNEAKLVDNKLRIYLQNLRAITKGHDYFSRDPVYAVQSLKSILDLQGSLSVILQAGHVMELRDVLDVQLTVSSANDQRIVEFTLGDMQVADGGELDGSLREVQLFFGNLPMPPK